MYTSDTEAARHACLGYGIAAAFCFGFQYLYSLFSHGVSSRFMTFAFLIPLLGGGIRYLSSCRFSGKGASLFRQLLCGGIVWLTLGSLFQGVLEIYGTTNHLVRIFAIVGCLQLLAAFAAGLLWKKRPDRAQI